MAGVVSMIAELDTTLPKSFDGNSSTKQSERVCCDALAVKNFANIDQQDAQVQQTRKNGETERGPEESDDEDAFLDDLLCAYEKLLVAAADGANKQDHAAVDVKSDSSSRGKKPEKSDTNDADPEKEEWSDHESDIDWAFADSGDYGFDGISYWDSFEEEVDEEIARASAMATEPPPEDLLHGLPREIAENILKNQPPPLVYKLDSGFFDDYFGYVEEEKPHYNPHEWCFT